MLRGIPIENRLRHFITDINRNMGFESFLNISRNRKYRSLHINWSLTFQHLDDDADYQSTNFTFSKKKAHRVKLLTEELPTIEHLKKRRYDLYRNWLCPICDNCDETFNHVFTCHRHQLKLKQIALSAKEYILKLIYDHTNTKLSSQYLDNIPFIWDLQYRNDELTFIDLIKGIAL